MVHKRETFLLWKRRSLGQCCRIMNLFLRFSTLSCSSSSSSSSSSSTSCSVRLTRLTTTLVARHTAVVPRKRNRFTEHIPGASPFRRERKPMPTRHALVAGACSSVSHRHAAAADLPASTSLLPTSLACKDKRSTRTRLLRYLGRSDSSALSGVVLFQLKE